MVARYSHHSRRYSDFVARFEIVQSKFQSDLETLDKRFDRRSDFISPQFDSRHFYADQLVDDDPDRYLWRPRRNRNFYCQPVLKFVKMKGTALSGSFFLMGGLS